VYTYSAPDKAAGMDLPLVIRTAYGTRGDAKRTYGGGRRPSTPRPSMQSWPTSQGSRHQTEIHFVLGKALRVREGRDATLISTGGLLQATVRAAERLADERIESRVLSMDTLKPLDTQAVLAAARETRAIITIEEHSIIGGLGSAVAEVLAEAEGAKVALKRIGLPPAFSSHVGSQEYLQERHGFTAEAISKCVTGMLQAVAKSSL
jgi:transketolase C-terminal domain/subunit